MAARVLVGVTAIVLGFASAFAGSQVLAAVVRGHRAADTAQGGSRSLGGLVAWRLRNGFAPVKPLASALLRVKPVERVVGGTARSLSERGVEAPSESVLSVILVCLLVLGILVGLVTGSVIAALASVACSCAVLAALSSNAKDKRREAVRDAIPDALESMSVCFGSGFTLLQTFRQVSEDTPGPLGKVFARCAHMLEMGAGAPTALEELRAGSQASELAFVAVALDVQHQSGGALRQVLSAATEAVKGELALRRALRVQTAQAKLSARVVSVMPLILVTAFSLASPDFLAPFFSSAYGYALLALAILMQVAGIVLVRRALNVEGVS